MNYYNSDTLLEQQQEIQKLKDERDAYLAELQKANAVIIDLQRNPPKMLESCLRQVMADAGRDGFVEGIRLRSKGPCNDWQAAANQYQASILAGKE